MTKERDTAARAAKGEGSVSRYHNHPTCPPAVGGVRPAHACKGPWRARVWAQPVGQPRKRVELYGATKAEVLRKKRELQTQEATGRLAPVGDRTTVGEWLDQWYAKNTTPNAKGVTKWKVNTAKGYRTTIDRHLKPHVGDVLLTKLDRAQVAELYDTLRERGGVGGTPLDESTVRKAHANLSRALMLATQAGRIPLNPCTMVEPPATNTSVPAVPLTLAEAWRVLDLAGEDPRFWLALFQGLRQGEVLGMRWSDVYLDATSKSGKPRPYLVVRSAASRKPGEGIVFDTPKSKASTGRKLPLVSFVAERLAKHQAQAIANGATPSDLVFTNSRGGAVDSRKDWTKWSTLLELAGITHTTLHSARSTTAQLLEDAGVPDRVAMAIIGHSDVKMLHHYQQGNEPAKERGMGKLDKHLRKAARRHLRAVEGVA